MSGAVHTRDLIRPGDRSVGTARLIFEVIDDHPHPDCATCKMGAPSPDAARWPEPAFRWDLRWAV